MTLWKKTAKIFLNVITLNRGTNPVTIMLQKSIDRNLKYNWKLFFNTGKTSPVMCVTMVPLLCPFLLESPKLKLKFAMKTLNNLKATYLVALLHISNENTVCLFEISRYIKYFKTRTKHLRLISYSSQTWSETPFFITSFGFPMDKVWKKNLCADFFQLNDLKPWVINSNY